MNNLKQFWLRLKNAGIDETTPEEEIEVIKVLNYGAIIIFLIDIFILPAFLWAKLFLKAIFILASASICVLIILANCYKKYLLPKLTVTILFPIIVTVCILIFGNGIHAESNYIVFVILTMLIYENLRLKIANILFIIILYIFQKIYLVHYQPIEAVQLGIFETCIAFFATLGMVIMILHLFYRNEKKRRLVLKDTLQEMEEKNAQLSVANAELERFAFIVSHDLKTPLRTIVSYTGLIERKIHNQQYDDIDTYLQYVKKGGIQLNDLINGILDFSRLNLEEEYDMEDIDLNEIFTTVTQRLDVFIQEKNAQVISYHLPIINTNRLFISLLFQNLIENGIKYNTDKAPKIQVSCIVEHNNIVLKFKDNGIGIAEEFHERIFKLFERLNNDGNGSGIGLGICKKIAERLGGTITLNSELGKGATFILTLPR